MHTPPTFTLLIVASFALAQAAHAQSPSSTAPRSSLLPLGATPKPAKDELLGEWEGHVVDGDGANAGQRRMNITLTIEPKRIVQHGSGGGEGTYRVSGTSRKLAHIDSTGTSGQYTGKRYEGIYSLEGDTLKWCAANPGKGRPRELRTNTGAGHFLMVLKRKN